MEPLALSAPVSVPAHSYIWELHEIAMDVKPQPKEPDPNKKHSIKQWTDMYEPEKSHCACFNSPVRRYRNECKPCVACLFNVIIAFKSCWLQDPNGLSVQIENKTKQKPAYPPGELLLNSYVHRNFVMCEVDRRSLLINLPLTNLCIVISKTSPGNMPSTIRWMQECHLVGNLGLSAYPVQIT